IEEAMKGPQVFGWMDYRIGMVGWELDFDRDFDNLTALVGVEGQITDEVAGRVALKVRDSCDPGGMVDLPGADPAPLPLVDGNEAEEVWLDEAFITFSRDSFPRGTHTIGRQFVKYGQGLLIDNQRQSIQGWRTTTNDVFGTSLDFDVFAGGANYTWNPTWTQQDLQPAERDSDGYVAARLSYDTSRGAFGVNYLGTGFDDERGFSVDYTGSIFGRALALEAATLTQQATGVEEMSGACGDVKDASAYMANLELLKGGNWALNGYYSRSDATYNPYYSVVNPYYETYASNAGAWPNDNVAGIPWERWLRNPLAMPNLEVLGGTLDITLGSTPFTLSYYDLDTTSSYSRTCGNSPDSSWWDSNPYYHGYRGMDPQYDTLYGISTTQELADGVNATFTYARQDAALAGKEDLEMAQAAIQIGF
ncbi:MAG: hypothetical protein ACLFWB_07090, partial [Armatimonadota bacterium]